MSRILTIEYSPNPSYDHTVTKNTIVAVYKYAIKTMKNILGITRESRVIVGIKGFKKIRNTYQSSVVSFRNIKSEQSAKALVYHRINGRGNIKKATYCGKTIYSLN